MTIRPLLTFLLALFLSSLAYPNHPWGSEITFRNTAKDKYTVQVIVYRNCAAMAFGSTVDVVVANQSRTHKVNLTASRKSITDISNACNRVTSPCYPTNTGFTGNGVEKHIYEVEIDLSESTFDSIMFSGEPILFESTQCCRNTSITNGSANFFLYNFALLDLKYGPNSSPFIENTARYAFGCNQSAYYNFRAIKELDGDSISYKFAHPREDYSTIISTKWPQVNCYYPGSLKYPYANPNANPPIGLSFDPETGELVFTPVHCSELGNVVVELTSWRKDSAGMYQISSVMRRDQLFMTTPSPGNYPPYIENRTYATACDTGEISLIIRMSDWVVRPPPPLPLPAPDTLSLRLLDTIEGATYTIIRDTVPNKIKLHFKWKPKKKDFGKRYSFAFEVRDNACPRNAITSRQVFVDLFKEIDGRIESKDLGCNEVEVSYVPVSSPRFTTYYQWQIYDSLGRLMSSRLVYFPFSRSNKGSRETDTFYAIKGGTYYMKLTVFGNGYCSKEFYDTIHIKGAIRPLFSKDTIVLCNTNSVTLKPDLYPISDFKAFAWSSHTTDSVYRFALFKWGSSAFALRAEPNSGCFHFDRLDVVRSTEPTLSYYVPNGLCSPIKYILSIQVYPGFDRQSTIWNDTVYSDTLMVKSGGTYHVEVHNLCGSVRDSIIINEWTKPEFDLAVNGNVFCNIDSMVLHSGLKNPSPKPSYLWDQTSSDSMYKIGGYEQHELQVTNVCGSTTDSIKFTELLNTPKANLGNDTVVCNDSLIRVSIVVPDGDIRWSDGNIIDNIRVSAPAKVWVDITNKCGVGSDTINLIRRYPPKQEMPTDTYTCQGRSLYLNAGNEGSTYYWAYHHSTKQIVRGGPGFYQVFIQNECGYGTFSTNVAHLDQPVVNLGRSDTMEIVNGFRTLDAGNPGSKYLWNTGDTTQKLKVKERGVYWVYVTNECGTGFGIITVVLLDIERIIRTTVNVFPNPTTGVVEIVTNPSYHIKRVRVFNALGQEVKEIRVYKKVDRLTVELPTGDRLLFLRIEAEEGETIIPILVESE